MTDHPTGPNGAPPAWPAYRPQDRLVAPVRPYAQLWRTLVGCLMIIVIVIGLNAVLRALLQPLLPADWFADLAFGRLPGPTLILLASFGFLSVAALAATFKIQLPPEPHLHYRTS